jgi:hypoxanthine phosphoribosyltransferase
MFLNLQSWQVDIMIAYLASLILPHKSRYQHVVGIANGGLHISKPLAAKLEIPHAEIRISHYNGHTPREIPIIEGQLPEGPCLIVDDLIDGGYTMQTCEKHFGKHDTAVLFWKEGSYKPTYYLQEKPPLWLNFPWSDE